MAPMDSLLEFSGLFLESISVSECYFHISKSFYYYFLIHPFFFFFAINNLFSINPFLLNADISFVTQQFVTVSTFPAVTGIGTTVVL